MKTLVLVTVAFFAATQAVNVGTPITSLLRNPMILLNCLNNNNIDISEVPTIDKFCNYKPDQRFIDVSACYIAESKLLNKNGEVNSEGIEDKQLLGKLNSLVAKLDKDGIPKTLEARVGPFALSYFRAVTNCE